MCYCKRVPGMTNYVDNLQRLRCATAVLAMAVGSRSFGGGNAWQVEKLLSIEIYRLEAYFRSWLPSSALGTGHVL